MDEWTRRIANLLSAIARDYDQDVTLALSALVDLSDHEPVSAEMRKKARWLWQLLYVSLLPVEPQEMK